MPHSNGHLGGPIFSVPQRPWLLAIVDGATGELWATAIAVDPDGMVVREEIPEGVQIGDGALSLGAFAG